MAEMQMVSPYPGPQSDEMSPSEASSDEDLVRTVLHAYNSAQPRDRFEAAVRALRRLKPNLFADEARRQVAEMICGAATELS